MMTKKAKSRVVALERQLRELSTRVRCLEGDHPALASIWRTENGRTTNVCGACGIIKHDTRGEGETK